MKSLANYITISRVFLVMTLFIFEPLSISFLVVYLICGFSDMLDGYVARKTNTTSAFGERLDSFADIVMVAVVIYILWPVVLIPESYVFWILLIIAIRIVSVIVVVFKFNTFGIVHTLANKITGLTLFLTPLFLNIVKIEILASILCVMGVVSAFEELMMHLTSKELLLNRRSLLIRKK